MHVATVGSAQDAFLRGMDVSTDELMPLGARLHASLLSWRFPGSSWDPEMVRALTAAMPAGAQAAAAGAGGFGGVLSSGAAGGAVSLGAAGGEARLGGAGAGGGGGGLWAMAALRQASWRAALRSVYLQLRDGSCPAFYLVAQGGGRPFTVLFCGRGARGCGIGTGGGGPAAAGAHAVVSQSTAAMRGKLSAAGVPFALPLAPALQDDLRRQQAAKLRKIEVDGSVEDQVAAAAAALARAEELAALRASAAAAAQWTSARDSTPESLLLVTGARAVHGLVDLLMNEVRSHPPLLEMVV
jgi:hypothetical protein